MLVISKRTLREIQGQYTYFPLIEIGFRPSLLGAILTIAHLLVKKMMDTYRLPANKYTVPRFQQAGWQCFARPLTAGVMCHEDL